eukprot:1175679-Prorocentrum_minimum.AAC.2
MLSVSDWSIARIYPHVLCPIGPYLGVVKPREGRELVGGVIQEVCEGRQEVYSLPVLHLHRHSSAVGHGHRSPPFGQGGSLLWERSARFEPGNHRNI